MEYLAALKTIQNEIETSRSGLATHQADLRILPIDAMAQYAKYLRVESGFDELAERYYAEGLGMVGRDRRREASLHHMIAKYYSFSDRNGKILPYLLKERAIWEGLGNAYQVMVCQDTLASYCSDSGRIALRNMLWEQAVALGRSYFQRPGPSATASEWLNYQDMRERWMDETAGPGQAARLKPIWLEVEAINRTYLFPKFGTYVSAANFLPSVAIGRRPLRSRKPRALSQPRNSQDSDWTRQRSACSTICCVQKRGFLLRREIWRRPGLRMRKSFSFKA